MGRADWILIAIAAAGGDALSPVQLQKSLFLIGETVPTVDRTDFYTFKPYNYGPFSREIYTDAEALAAEGLIMISSGPGQTWSDYRATMAGLEKSKELKSRLDDAQCAYIDGLINWLRKLSFEQLLKFIYSRYPEYAVNSMFRVAK